MKPKSVPPRELLEQFDQLGPDALADAGFDADKVKRLRAAILAGTYAGDPDRIADGLLAKARVLAEGKQKKKKD